MCRTTFECISLLFECTQVSITIQTGSHSIAASLTRCSAHLAARGSAAGPALLCHEGPYVGHWLRRHSPHLLSGYDSTMYLFNGSFVSELLDSGLDAIVATVVVWLCVCVLLYVVRGAQLANSASTQHLHSQLVPWRESRVSLAGRHFVWFVLYCIAMYYRTLVLHLKLWNCVCFSLIT